LSENCIKKGNFILASGEPSDFYIDIKSLLLHPFYLKKVAEMILSRVDEKVNVVAGVELGAVPIVSAMIVLSGNHHGLIVRKDKKAYGIGDRLIGTIPPKSKILFVEDVVTTGGSVLNAINLLKETEHEVIQVLSIFDRGHSSKKKKLLPNYNFLFNMESINAA